MRFFDAMKDRLSSNLKFVKLSYLTRPDEIIQFCQSLTPGERDVVLKGIESSFKWQPVALIAQAFYPTVVGPSGVSEDAMDLVRGGFVEGGIELMKSQSQPPPQQFGMTATQQAVYSFAWVVLKAIEQESNAAPASVAVCRGCRARRRSADPFCQSCGRPF
ncbi:MAG: hypothetical protein ACRD9S_21585 [Pyrinomonadaceae bacterium]